MKQIELSDDDYALLLIALGAAMAVFSSRDDVQLVPAVRKLIGIIAPTSYWGLPNAEKQ